MTTLKALALVAALALPGAAQAWEEPARGTELRADLMDALRPMAEWDLGAPVEFVVLDLRVAGDVAFASVMAQRPGGAPIVILQHARDIGIGQTVKAIAPETPVMDFGR